MHTRPTERKPPNSRLRPRFGPGAGSGLALACALISSVGACDAPKDEGAKAGDQQGRAQARAGENGSTQAAPTPASEPTAQLLSNEIIDLSAVLTASPEEAEKLLGAAKEADTHESSCVRFLPERVFFKCEHDMRMYEHPKLGYLTIDYQDGAAAELAFVGPVSEVEFSLDAAMGFLGLVLPGEPRHSNPGANTGKRGDIVDLWDWGNSGARLAIDGHQFRVRISSLNLSWEGTKIEIIDNSPLTSDQQARIMPIKGAAGEAGAGDGDSSSAVSGPLELAPKAG